MTNGLVLAEEKTGWWARIVPHASIDSLWIIKAADEAALARFFDLANGKPTKTLRGKNFWIAPATDNDLHRAMAALLHLSRTSSSEVV